MKLLRYFRGLGLLAAASLLFAVTQATALSATSTVDLSVPDTQIQLTGQAAPNALVTVKEAGSTIGSVAADSSGLFSLLLSSQSSGLRTLVLSYVDVVGASSAALSKQINVQPQHTTTLSGFLSPTLTRRTTSPTQVGSIVQLTGYTLPNTTVKLSLGTSGFTQSTTSNGAGFYEFLAATASLPPRTYTAHTQAFSTLHGTSEPSQNVTFELAAASAPSSPDLVVALSQLQPPVTILPESGTTINGNTVIITGESAPYAQISAYVHGKQVGSVVASKYGKWSFRYTATTTPVSLYFEACIDGRCSVRAGPITYQFRLASAACQVEFALQTYRFWGVKRQQPFSLSPLQGTNAPGTLRIDWDDGTVELFDYNPSKPHHFTKSYERAGLYNGHIRFTQTYPDSPDCVIDHYFSVHVIDRTNTTLWLWLTILLVGTTAYLIARDRRTRR